MRFQVDGEIITKATKLEDTQQNRDFVKKQVIPMLNQKIASGYFDKRPKTVKDFAILYLKSKDDLKTYFEIQSRVEKILKVFGDREIVDIRVSELRSWISSFAVTPKTIKSYVVDFRGIYDLAVYDEVVEKNPFNGQLKLPKHTKEEISSFSCDDVAKVMSEAKGQLLSFFAIGFYTGMRPGEIIALSLSDIDFTNKVIQVRKSISKGKITTPKTRLSIRQVPILDDLVPYLQQQVQSAVEAKSIYLFCQENGEMYKDISSLNANRFLKNLGIQNRAYDTRHTFITNMLNSGTIKLMDLARMVGHSSPQMILTTYAKYVKGEKINVDNSLKLYEEKSQKMRLGTI